MKAKVLIGDSIQYVTFPEELKEDVIKFVDEFYDHTEQDWYFVRKDYNIIRLEGLEDIEEKLY